MIIFLRHAATTKDPTRPATGWRLVREAVGPCRALAGLLHDHGFGDGVHGVSSPELKARETAAYVTDEPVQPEDDLREVRRGGWDGAHGDTVAEFVTAPDRAAHGVWETARDARTRFGTALERLIVSTPRPLAVVGHGLVFRAWAMANATGPEQLAF